MWMPSCIPRESDCKRGCLIIVRTLCSTLWTPIFVPSHLDAYSVGSGREKKGHGGRNGCQAWAKPQGVPLNQVNDMVPWRNQTAPCGELITMDPFHNRGVYDLSLVGKTFILDLDLFSLPVRPLLEYHWSPDTLSRHLAGPCFYPGMPGGGGTRW